MMFRIRLIHRRWNLSGDLDADHFGMEDL